jgi:tRNA pseudouridine synthase 10
MGAEGTTKDPEIVFLADLPAGRVEVTVLPVYLRGRYRKFDRSLPQTHWPCRKCRGRGCFACGGSGKTYPISVEELIAGPAQEAVGGAGVRFHGMGREDIDARMLGEGRPFVLEILQPRRRTIDLRALETQVNLQSNGRLEIEGLRSAEARAVLEVKEASPQKSYRVGILGTVSVAKVNEVLQVVRGQAIAQRTPTRVAHRRSDRIRERKIIEARLVEAEEGRFTLDLRTEAGTYVKEWVEGDAGRTEPNLSALLGTPLKVEYLDVLEVHDKEG